MLELKCFLADRLSDVNVILFSGGLDSTLLLTSTVEAIENTCSMNGGFRTKEILVISVEADFSFKKVDRERDAREKILAYLRSKHPSVKIRHNKLGISIRDFSIAPDPANTQILFWLYALVNGIPVNKQNTTSILFSFIAEDQVTHTYKEIEEVIRLSCSIGKLDSDIVKPKNFFPMKSVRKFEVVGEMMRNHRDLFEIVTYCENAGEQDFCGKCNPCKLMKSALLYLAVNYSGEMSEYALYYLKYWFDVDVTINHNDHKKIKSDLQNKAKNITLKIQ